MRIAAPATLAVLVLALAACSSPDTPSGTPAAPSSASQAAPATDTPEPAASPSESNDDTADLSDLPLTAQMYAQTGRSMVRNGTVPRSRVTPEFVRDELAGQGVELTDAQVDQLVAYLFG